MALRHAPIAIAALWLIGCGGSSAKPDGGSGTGGSLSGSAGSGGSSTGGGGGSTGGSTGGGTAGANPTGSLVLPGQDWVLLDTGAPCTYEAGATGDRWCAVIGSSAAAGVGSPLWVINVSKAAAGTSVNCATGTDLNCLKLLDSFAEDPAGYHPSGFTGDTLIYYDNDGAGTYTPFAWRPGMTSGRQLATGNVASDVWSCTADTKGTAVWCLRDLPSAMQTDPANMLLSDILAGHLDGAATPPLARIETVISGSSSDNPKFSPHFKVAFPVPGSETIAWSARASLTGVEVLKTQTLGNDASRVTVASDVTRWQVSPDSTRWYWLSHVDDATSTSTGAGTLQAAAYPAGTGPVMIAANALQFVFPTNGSLAVVNSSKALTAIADPIGAPATTTALDTGVVAVISASKAGQLVYVKNAKTVNQDVISDLFTKKLDGTGACTLTTSTDAFTFSFAFTPSAAGASWLQRTIASQAAQYTRLSDCAKMTVSPVGSTAFFAQPLGDRGILYVDDSGSTTGTATLNLQPLDATAALSGSASVVSGQVGTAIATASGGVDILVYTVNGGGTDDGVYVRGFGP